MKLCSIVLFVIILVTIRSSSIVERSEDEYENPCESNEGIIIKDTDTEQERCSPLDCVGYDEYDEHPVLTPSDIVLNEGQKLKFY